MKSFARITAIIFMIVGVVVIMLGVGMTVNGYLKPPTPSPFSLAPNLSGLVRLCRDHCRRRSRLPGTLAGSHRAGPLAHGRYRR